MNHLSERIGDALCYTAFAPVVRWLRRRHQAILAREQYDYRRIDSILNQVREELNKFQSVQIINDIKELIEHFKRISNSNNFRLTLAAIDNNMCRRFHTDMNDLRMICTYSGPGTLWLTENNTNRMPLNNTGNNDSIVINENKIKQLSTGSVAILKGALYPG